MNNFWQKFKKPFDNAQGKPILCLAPMADVTDSAFRYIIAKYSKGFPDTSSSLCTDIFLLENSSCSPQSGSQGTLERVSGNPYVTYTEFVSADGLVLAPEKGKAKLLKDLEFLEIERPIVAQLFTSKPEIMEKAAALILELGFDGLDINMGCPDKSVEKQGAGSALIKNLKIAREVVAAAKRGVKNRIPVSVKTRLGYNKDELEDWLPELLAENPAAIIIHARTRKEMSKVPARWERIKRAVEIRDKVYSQKHDFRGTDKILLNFSSCSPQSGSQAPENHVSENSTPENFFPESKTLILGNGDVENVQDAIKKCEETGADGAMIGRGVFGNPWVFSDHQPTLKEKLGALLEHTKLFEKNLGSIKSFAIMKKHFKSYLAGFDVPKEFKERLMATENADEVEQLVKSFGV